MATTRNFRYDICYQIIDVALIQITSTRHGMILQCSCVSCIANKSRQLLRKPKIGAFSMRVNIIMWDTGLQMFEAVLALRYRAKKVLNDNVTHQITL